MKNLLNKYSIFIIGSVLYVLSFLLYLYFANTDPIWKLFYYLKDYGYILFILFFVKKYFIPKEYNKILSFIIVVIFQYFYFNLVILTKDYTNFEKYCNSQVFTLMFSNAILSILFFLFLTSGNKDN